MPSYFFNYSELTDDSAIVISAALLAPLNLGAQIVETTTSELDPPERSRKVVARTLKIVLAINAGMFVAEMIGAYLADSSALLADSLDMPRCTASRCSA